MFRENLTKPVFYPSLVIVLTIVLYCGFSPQSEDDLFQQMNAWLTLKSGWLYILSVAIFFLFCIGVMFSRFGDIKLGPDDSTPEYSNTSWFSMLFATGMGGGMLFFGVAEPVMHYMSPPTGAAETVDAAREAMRITLFHWGLHAWAVYALVGLSLAYFAHRHKLPLLPRSALYPFLGDQIYGPLGHCVDICAVLGTLFGLATSLGLGASQLSAGVSYTLGIADTNALKIGIIVLITACAAISLLLGLDRGVKRLSSLNMGMAVVLLAFVFIAGPSVFLCKTLLQNIGTYLSSLINATFNMYAYEPQEVWFGGWTLFYWAWWIAWSPFVGVFVAKISRGRTIREFISGALFVPVGFTVLWFTVFGNSALDTIIHDTTSQLGHAVSTSISQALFVFFEHLPFTRFISIYTLLLLVIFFISSVDSGALVINELTSVVTSSRKSRWRGVLWATLGCLIASALLATGGLESLQLWLILTAYPFMLIMLVYCVALWKQLREDSMLSDCVQTHHTSIQYARTNVSWEQRLESLLHHPTAKEARQFIKTLAQPALEKLSQQMEKQGLSTKLVIEVNKVMLTINKDDLEDFSYGVHLRRYAVPSYADEENDGYYRAEVFLSQGGQRYDVLGYTEQQIIADALTQYERHLHFLHLAASETL